MALRSVRGVLGSSLPLWLVFPLALSGAGCGKEYVRGSDDPSVDHAAMGTGLDKVDIQKLLTECLNDLRVHPLMAQWRAAGKQATVAVFPFQNDTSEHIDSALAAILAETENWLIEGGTTVIDRQRQNQLIAEIEGTRSPVFDQKSIPRYGKQLGVKYYVTGNVQAPSERTEDERRVQYFLFLRIVEVETGAIVWQHKAHVTKMVRLADAEVVPAASPRGARVVRRAAASLCKPFGANEARPERARRG
jgi:hypothetical protein